MSQRITVRLLGGPFHDAEVPAFWGESLILSGGTLTEGTVARYRPTRTRGVYRFRGFDTVVATIPAPPA